MSFSEDLSKQRFLKLVELRPPKGVVVDELLEVAGRLHGRVDAFLVTDCAGAVMTLNPLVVSRRLVAAGHQVVMHVSCRDRNRMAIQSLLLGAGAEGVNNIFITRGTDAAYGDHPRARTVYDMEVHELVAATRTLSSGKDLAGNPIEGELSFTCGAEVNPWYEGDALEEEVKEAGRRVEAGAQFLMTPPVHDARRIRHFSERLRPLGVPLVARVLLIKSVGMARYLNLNVAGCRIPDDTIKRLRKAPDKTAESIRIAADLITDLKDVCGGACIMPLGWERQLPAMMDLL
jgi:5,10-methylenetetrahydrofolate reductase